jgi:hypothetical protein
MRDADVRRVGRPRRGAGVRETVSLRLDPVLLEQIDDDAERREESRTDWIEAAARARLAVSIGTSDRDERPDPGRGSRRRKPR